MTSSGNPSSERRSLPLVPWTDETRRGSFESFFAAYGRVPRAEFLASFKAPVLMTAVSTDSATWNSTLVLKVEKRATSAKIAISDDGSSGDIESAAGRIYVGRTAESDVIIAAPTVSKKHAFFTCREMFWEITDAGSSNGTILDGQTLRANRRERIRRSLSTIEFGPDARFVFMLPDSVFDLFEEIHRSRGMRAHVALGGPRKDSPVLGEEDERDFESLRSAPVEEDPSTSIVQRSVTKPVEAKPEPTPLAPPAEKPPAPPAERPPVAKPPAAKPPAAKPPAKEAVRPRHRSTWQGKRPDGLDADAETLGRSTDKIAIAVGKTPQEVEDINFDYALRAVSSLGALIQKLEAVLKLNDQVVVLLGGGSKNSIDECKDALLKMRPLLGAIRMELSVGDRKPVEIFKAQG